METNGSTFKPKAAPLAGILLGVLVAVLVVGVLTFAGPCAEHPDGSIPVCTWAFRAVIATCVVIAVISIVRVFETDEGERRGLSFAAGLLGALVAAIPGFVIDLCADPTMPCNAAMRPFMTCVGAAIFLVGVVDLTVRLLRIRKRD